MLVHQSLTGAVEMRVGRPRAEELRVRLAMWPPAGHAGVAEEQSLQGALPLSGDQE